MFWSQIPKEGRDTEEEWKVIPSHTDLHHDSAIAAASLRCQFEKLSGELAVGGERINYQYAEVCRTADLESVR